MAAESTIQSRPNVCGGVPRIRSTRIPVWLLEQLRRLGATDETILESFPSLTAEDLSAAWDYTRAHADEIDAQIQENEAA